MDLSPLKNLSPEEREALKAALDAEPEQDPMQKVASTVQYLCEEVDAAKELIKSLMDQHDALKELVVKELIGGLSEAYSKNLEEDEFDGFKSKHGGMLEPFAAKFGGAYPGEDLLRRAFKHIREMSSDDGFSDEVASSELEKIVNQIKERLGEPASVEVKVEGETDEEPEEDAVSAWNEIDMMKRRDDSREARKKGA